MTDLFGPADPALRHDESSAQGNTASRLHLWVSACLEAGMQEVDRMIVTAPSDLRMAYPCYDVMADEIEISVQRVWCDIARKRMRVAH